MSGVRLTAIQNVALRDRLARAAEVKALDQRAIAEAIGLSQQGVSTFLAGKTGVSRKAAQRIAAFVGEALDDLLGPGAVEATPSAVLLGAKLLADYLAARDLSIYAFAKTHGLDGNHLQRVIKGERSRINIDLVLDIEAATDGAVPVASWRMKAPGAAVTPEALAERLVRLEQTVARLAHSVDALRGQR